MGRQSLCLLLFPRKVDATQRKQIAEEDTVFVDGLRTIRGDTPVCDQVAEVTVRLRLEPSWLFDRRPRVVGSDHAAPGHHAHHRQRGRNDA